MNIQKYPVKSFRLQISPTKWSVSKKMVNTITAGIAAFPSSAGWGQRGMQWGSSYCSALISAPGSTHRETQTNFNGSTEMDQGVRKERTVNVQYAERTLGGIGELSAEILRVVGRMRAELSL